MRLLLVFPVICLLLSPVWGMTADTSKVFLSHQDLTRLDGPISDLVVAIWLDGKPVSDEAINALKTWIVAHPNTRVWGYIHLYRGRGDDLNQSLLEQTIDGKKMKEGDGAYFNFNDQDFIDWQLKELRELLRRLPSIYGIHVNFRMSKAEIFAYSPETRVACLEEIGIDPIDVLPDPGNDPSEKAITKKWLDWREMQNAKYVAKVITLAREAGKQVSIHGYLDPSLEDRVRITANWTLLAGAVDQVILERIDDCSDEQLQSVIEKAKKLNPNLWAAVLILPDDQPLSPSLEKLTDTPYDYQ